jgi:cell wall-associated protease
MKTSRVLAALLFLSLAACSKDRVPLSEALKKEHPKNHVPQRVLTDTKRELENWFTKDAELDSAEGTGADRAFAELELKHHKEIIVAVIDSGVDIHHEDLKNKIWINKGEIPGNGIDDDGNGYVDDIHGWNFIGGVDAEGNPIHINAEQLEVTRELIKMKAKKKSLEEQGLTLSEEEVAYLQKISKEVSAALEEADVVIEMLTGYLSELRRHYEVIKDLLKVSFDEMSLASVQALKTETEGQAEAKKKIIEIFMKGGAADVARFVRVKTYYEHDKKYYYNENFQPRQEIVKDNPEDFSDTAYGNNDVIGPGADHGTHVAGIIAADRDNELGIRGIAQNVKIMALRAVPDGDERDKDVALAVRYAVDNGALIINMSFGKGYSPHKSEVSKAFKYAEEKGVLVLHAAGNESTDRDQEDRFPTRMVYDDAGNVVDEIKTWLDVGASSQFRDRTLTATFTNYGQTMVDLFAPGVNLNSTIPGNKYAVFSGTSMACPSAAGVAALVWSQMPELSAVELKDRLLSTVRSRAGLMVRLPSDHSQDVPFETLSITGGIADAFKTLKESLQ